MKGLSIFILLFTFCGISIAQKTVKYLPSKMISAGDTCQFDYDNLNRIIRQKTITPQTNNICRVESHFYTYSDTDNFTDKCESYSQSNDSIFDLDTRLNKYQNHGSYFSCSNIKLSSPIGDNSIDSTFEGKLQIDSNGFVTKISSLLEGAISISTTFNYDSLQRIDNIKQEYDVGHIEEGSDIMNLKYDISDANTGVFRDINFTPITKIAQVGKIPFIIANQIPNEISLWTSKYPKRLEQKRIECIFDENGYPKSIIVKDIEKDDITLISDIEYTKIEN